MAFAATLAPGSTRVVVYFVAGLGAALVIWDALQRWNRRSRGRTSKHPKTELVISHHRTTAQIKGYGFPYDNAYVTEHGGIGLMDIKTVCYVAVPEGLPIVQLHSGIASIEIDDRRYDEEVRISQTILAWQEDGYRIPPFVKPGETLQIDVSFFGSVLWDNGWVMPQECKIRKLVLVDQYKEKHLLKEEIKFHASWVASLPSLSEGLSRGT